MDHSSPYPPQPQLQEGHEYLQQPQAQPYSTNTANKMDYSSPYPPQPQAQAQPYSTNSENQVDYSSAYLPQPQLGYEHLQQPQQAQEQVFQHQDSLDSTQPQTYDPSHYPYPYPYDQQQQQYPYYPLTHQPISDPPPPRHLVMIAPKPHRGGRSGRPSRGRGRGRQIPSSSASLPRQPQAQAQAQVQAQPQRYHCEVCMVGCNSGEILEMHNKGKKHKKKLQELERASRKLETDESEKNAEGDGDAGAEPKGEEDGKKRKSVAGERGGKSRRLEGEADALVCEVCDVKCHTVAVMEIHLKGKKHRSKVGKLGPQIGTSEDPQIALTRLLRTYAASNARLDTAQIKCLVDLCNIVINSIAAASAPVESVEQVSDQSHEDKTQ